MNKRIVIEIDEEVKKEIQHKAVEMGFSLKELFLKMWDLYRDFTANRD